MARVTIIIPTHNHGCLLHTAVRSVLRQSVQDFELFIIGDGVTAETREAAAQAVAMDSRIRYFDHPKSPRTGEPYRHQALQQAATGEVVCYLADDDIWMPHHLEIMCRTLENADMAHALPLCVNGEGEVSSTLVDLALPEWVQWTLDGQCKTSLSFVGHTMEFYRRLPHGWRTTPAGNYTDHYMWVQMLSVPGMRATCTGEYSLIGLPSLMRKGRTLEQREEELLAWEKKITEHPAGVLQLAQRSIAHGFYHAETGYHILHAHNQQLRAENEVLRYKATLRGILGRLVKWRRKKRA